MYVSVQLSLISIFLETLASFVLYGLLHTIAGRILFKELSIVSIALQSIGIVRVHSDSFEDQLVM